MNMFRTGAVMALGAVTALIVLAIILAGGLVGYRYLNADHLRLELVGNAQVACRNGRGEFRSPPASMPLIHQLTYLEKQNVGLGECAVAKMRLLSYDLGIEVDES